MFLLLAPTANWVRLGDSLEALTELTESCPLSYAYDRGRYRFPSARRETLGAESGRVSSAKLPLSS